MRSNCTTTRLSASIVWFLLLRVNGKKSASGLCLGPEANSFGEVMLVASMATSQANSGFKSGRGGFCFWKNVDILYAACLAASITLSSPELVQPPGGLTRAASSGPQVPGVY